MAVAPGAHMAASVKWFSDPTTFSSSKAHVILALFLMIGCEIKPQFKLYTRLVTCYVVLNNIFKVEQNNYIYEQTHFHYASRLVRRWRLGAFEANYQKEVRLISQQSMLSLLRICT
jgi:hypothetical protein